MFLAPFLLAGTLGLAQAGTEPQTEVRVVGAARPNAQTPATLVVEPAAMLIVACDTDGDGRTTRTELDACLERMFVASGHAADAAIGYIDYGQWQQRWLGDQGALPSPFEVDRDGDNRITLAELQVQFSKLFGRYDKDADKAVTRAEALTVRATAADGRGPVGGGGPRSRKRKSERPRGEHIPGGRPEDGAEGQP